MTHPSKTLLSLICMTALAAYGIRPPQYPGLGSKSRLALNTHGEDNRIPAFHSVNGSQLKYTGRLLDTVVLDNEILKYITQGKRYEI